MANVDIRDKERDKMSMVEEFEAAIDSVLRDIDESDAFKKRLKKLIQNSLENSYRTEDILGIIELATASPKGDY